jgi:hypothetical protein
MNPTYMTDSGPIEYTPPVEICSLRRYNLAHCARLRMLEALASLQFDFELWKRERVTFWSTLRESIPHNFK